ncbi:uncharacterized protein LOC113371226 [Ctenocephalides felis]|uniref:uncharacterized protein LOC113371226 n=1 Tax=Ctenocephalides felis TaxID=7515 RepID=UPI000E6E1B6E|nr:uncharacterized protein LOC113371226 [Ctenocephalides felis]
MDNTPGSQVANNYTHGGARLQVSSNNVYNYQKNNYQHLSNYQDIGYPDNDYNLSKNTLERFSDETDSSLIKQISTICQVDCASPQRNQTDDAIIYQEGTPGAAAKGLRNAPGQNNCFLNSAVQSYLSSCSRIFGMTNGTNLNNF